jgi:LmbE family N-acetylglucosaminyl deacetylase
MLPSKSQLLLRAFVCQPRKFLFHWSLYRVNPYQHFTAEHARLMKAGKSLPLGGFAPAAKPKFRPGAPKVLIFSPHPDDECIIGALPLRLLREARMEVINVAVTQGSKRSRRAARRHELARACQYLGFGLRLAAPNGLENITAEARAKNKAAWAKPVQIMADILLQERPQIIFVPHEKDGHETHIGTHLLVFDALKSLPMSFTCFVVKTEFWGAMESPNLMVESSVRDVANLVAALSFHQGEVKRNPYHLRLPAWMQDNVRRGSELVGGHGASAPDFIFATLYRLSCWRKGGLKEALTPGRQISVDGDVAGLFAGKR